MSSARLINIYIDIYLCSYALTQRLTIRLVVLHAQHTFKYTYKYMNTIPFNKSIFRISLVNLYKHYVAYNNYNISNTNAITLVGIV